MANRYARITLVARRIDGSAVPGAEIAVYKKSTGALATLYSGDNLSGSVSNPVFASSTGSVSFYAGDNKDNYTFVPVDSSVIVSSEAPVDTVENHRQTGEHAAGTITAEQLSFTITDVDVAVHAAMEANTHGLGATEHFVHTKAGTAAGATDSPALANVTCDTFTTAQFLGYTVVEDPSGTGLASAIAAASSDDTLVLPEGTHVLTSGVTISTTQTLLGLGHDCVLRLASGTGPVVTVSGVGRLRNLTVSHLGSGYCVAASGGALYLENVKISGTNGVSYAGGLFRSSVTDCEIAASSTALLVNGSGHNNEALSFKGNNISGAVTLTAPTTFPVGIEFSGNTITGAFTSSMPNTWMLGNHINGNVTFNSTASQSLFPTNGNTYTGTLTGDVYATGFNDWEYVSAWIDLDNSASTYTDEFYYFGASGFASAFPHGLGSRQLEIMLQVANNSTGSDERWTIYPSPCSLDIDAGAGTAGDFPVPAMAQFAAHIVDGSNVRIVGYAGEHQTGSGAVGTAGKTLFAAVDSQAIVSAAEADDYNFAAAGGYSLDRIWVKVFIRRAF